MGLLSKLVSAVSRSCYKIASRHPLLVFMLFVLIWLRRAFPLLFYLLVHASPVIASTLALLGTLLFYGHANAPEAQKEGKLHHHEISNPEIRVMRNGEMNKMNKMNVSDNHKVGSLIDAKRKHDGKSELGVEKPILMNFCAQFQPSSDVSGRKLIDLLNETPVHVYDDNKGWESGSDFAGSSSPTASMVDIYSMLDELRPLSESSVPFPHVSTDATSDQSLESGEFVHEADYDDGDQEDVVGHDDEDEPVIPWAEDGQRSVMNLGTPELERTQLFENLVARQKALKNMRMQAEKNMVNTNATHMSTARNNHLDLPYHSGMIPRRDSFDLPFDPSGPQPERVGPTFHMNEPLGHRRESFGLGPLILEPEPVASDPESSGSPHDPREFIIHRSHDGTVHLQQVAQPDDKINSVKTSGGNTGYEEQTSSKSSASSFFDVTDDIDDGDNDDVEEDYRSIDSSESDDPKELQVEDSSDSSDSSDETEDESPEGPVEVPSGIRSWFSSWKA